MNKSAVLAIVASLVGGASYAASAAPAPASSKTSTTLFMRAEGCGTTQEAGRLEIKSGADGSTGCGTIGGLPLTEIDHATGQGLFSADTYDSAKGLTFKIDATNKITGQVACGAHNAPVSMGIGTCTFDLALVGTSTAGKTVDFGTVTVSGTSNAPTALIDAPFEFAIPATAKGLTLKKLSLSVQMRGQNVGMSSKRLSGESYLVVPVRK